MFESNLYWTTRANELIRQDKFGRGVPQTLARDLGSPGGVRIYHQLRYNVSLRDPCHSVDCSHLCVAVPRGHRCLCPDRPTPSPIIINDIVCDATIEREKPAPRVSFFLFFSVSLIIMYSLMILVYLGLDLYVSKWWLLLGG